MVNFLDITLLIIPLTFMLGNNPKSIYNTKGGVKFLIQVVRIVILVGQGAIGAGNEGWQLLKG